MEVEEKPAKTILEDDTNQPVVHLIEHRVPWLILGLVGGIIATIISSQFEGLLNKHVSLAFFIPVIVYMSDAVGTQTETIFIRHAGHGKSVFSKYILKESILGASLGVIFGTAIGVFTLIWFKSYETALTVGLAMAINVAIAPVMALVIPTILERERTDPALGSGPFTTILQDLISLLVYFSIASLIIFH